VQLGVHLPHFGARIAVDDIAGFARCAEALGFHSAWVADHLVFPVEVRSRNPYMPEGTYLGSPELPILEPFTVLAFAAGATSRIKLGTSVLVVPLRHPVVLARQLGALQAMSGGRVILGAGAGWMQEEFEMVGVPFAERGERLHEALRLIRLVCAESPVEFHGRFYDMPPSGTLPVPAVPLPIWVGGNTTSAIRRAADFDGWHALRIHAGDIRAARPTLPAGCTISVRRRVVPDAIDAFVAECDELAEAGATHVLADVDAPLGELQDAWAALAAAVPDWLEPTM
jgi:probable F420-dependent oxidoreductase